MRHENDIFNPYDTQPIEPVDPPQEFDAPIIPAQAEQPESESLSSEPLFQNPMYVESATEPLQPAFGRRMVRAMKDILETIVPAVVIALLINLFLAQATRVYGQSMEPNLHTDQRLVVEKISYKLHDPNRGDVAVLKVHDDSEELLIKRIIALPGETVEIKNGVVYVDNAALNEPYLSQPTRGRYGPLQVPTDSIFVLGDNRGASNDSRSFGTVKLDNIVGRAWVSYWPVEEIGIVE